MNPRDMDQPIIAELARTGTLRAGINMGNFLLVTGMGSTGDPEGVAPDLGACCEITAVEVMAG